MPGTRPIAVLTALCLWLWSTGAWARPAVMVWPGSPQTPVQAVEDALREEAVVVVGWEETRDALAAHRADADREHHRALEAALAGSQARYLELKFDGMVKTLEAAWPHARARAGRCDGAWALAFGLGLAYGARRGEGDQRRSLDHYQLALALDPERRPRGELYGPDVTAAFLRAVQQHEGRTARPVSLRVEPHGARVEIDCRAVTGTEPGVAAGLHLVRITSPGFAPWAGVVDLRGRDVIERRLEPLPPGDPTGRLAMSTDDEAVDDGAARAHALVLALARARDADAVLVVSQVSAGWRVRPWGRDGIGAAVVRPELETALDAALGLLTDDGRLHAPAPAATSEPGSSPPRRRPVARTWWFWTIIGGVAATGVALALGLTVGRREAPPGRLVIIAE